MLYTIFCLNGSRHTNACLNFHSHHTGLVGSHNYPLPFNSHLPLLKTIEADLIYKDRNEKWQD